jgi:hypothetical protein
MVDGLLMVADATFMSFDHSLDMWMLVIYEMNKVHLLKINIQHKKDSNQKSIKDKYI